MLSAPNRLIKSADFSRVVRRGQRQGGPLLVTHLLTDAFESQTQVGFVVSKAVGNAVTRNLVKRRLRHLMRLRVAALPTGSGVVVRALPSAANASHTELSLALDRCLNGLTSR
ncbi:MAG TPA: ribonuclease P protein component [Marmoricola sp.]|nr:ribonuclease P protein component [Marmoricola sp.]HNJ78539.1 ribonuclease P protein component [Marmoricola sp.]HNN48145.1 ribonuclease P protein component [Marmoricola sp.]HNO38777.1 ribonuclease P protein component [Marmoricola sp.]